MRWLRLRQQYCSWVALLALALQLVLSFGHVHGLPTGGPTAVAAISEGSGSPPQPAGGEQHDDDYCAICAVQALLSSGQTASAPALPVVAAPAATEIIFTVERVRANRPLAAFRSRAPPIS
jgi:DUF2946 family protein